MAVTGIFSFRKNVMGTVSFDAKFKGMRKSQDFIVYPITEDKPQMVKIQSDTRIGQIDLADGKVILSPPVPGGAYFTHLLLAKEVETLTAAELESLKNHIRKTAGASVGTAGVVTNNSGAANV